MKRIVVILFLLISINIFADSISDAYTEVKKVIIKKQDIYLIKLVKIKIQKDVLI